MNRTPHLRSIETVFDRAHQSDYWRRGTRQKMWHPPLCGFLPPGGHNPTRLIADVAKLRSRKKKAI